MDQKGSIIPASLSENGEVEVPCPSAPPAYFTPGVPYQCGQPDCAQAAGGRCRIIAQVLRQIEVQLNREGKICHKKDRNHKGIP